MSDEVKLSRAQTRDLVAAILTCGVASAKPNAKPEDAYVFYQRIRSEIEKKGLAPK
ncbi:MAG TPA: hypothetical protein VHL34_08000 [Rhizomicrobium sp.]|jgi:hypothetical protein|nr:hypothetical protein [Rhizomicrobium sp.]